MQKGEEKLSISSDKQTDAEQALRFLVAQPLRASDRFMKKLYTDDAFFRTSRYALVAEGEAKKLYLYGSARQVKKASVQLIQQVESIKESPDKSNEPTTLDREIIEAAADEQSLWVRKLIETLINLINFQDTNINEAYRIFLSAENLDLFLGKQKDFKDFYDFRSKNVQSSIDIFFSRIEDDLKTLNLLTIWFLDHNKFRNKEVPVFNKIRPRYKSALKLATDGEKVVLGATYHEFFSMTSLSVHSSISSSPRKIDFDTIRTNISHISLLCQHVISRANKLMGFDDSEDIEKFLIKDSIAPNLMEKYKRKFDVGDLVLACNDLAEILEAKKSSFGYTCYRVKFLRTPHIPEMPKDWLPPEEDWLSSEYIVRLVAKNKIREFHSKMLEKSPHLKEEIKLLLDQPDELLFEAMKKTFIDLDKRGLLIPMFFGTKK